MNILLTGANGYIGQRLMPVLLNENHTVYASVRDPNRFKNTYRLPREQIIKLDLMNIDREDQLPENIDVAFYLVHSMSGGGDFEDAEAQIAKNFLELIERTRCRQVIYLTGIVNADKLSPHLQSRLKVEQILSSGTVPLTALRAGIIVGSGSASFEIIRDLTEKLPVMIAPKWLNTRTQPIAIRNVIEFLMGVLGREKHYNKSYDISAHEVMTYRDMLLGFAKVRGLKRWIYTVPVMTPKLSSYWLYFITSTSFNLALNLVDSMKVDVIAKPNDLAAELGIELIDYESAVELAFQKIEQKMVVSSWKDAFSVSHTNTELMNQIEFPTHGCYIDRKTRKINSENRDVVIDRIWSIGGDTGWYYSNLLWKLRGYLDKVMGGIGLRRGRTHPTEIHPGDALDFWRVIVADKKEGRLLLFAEMKLPGEAWLEFKLMEENGALFLQQSAVFRPLGVQGRIYWYSVLPFHFFIFSGLINRLTKSE
nr:SDR family oxidoreductase [Saprospiraceae bacterium]